MLINIYYFSDCDWEKQDILVSYYWLILCAFKKEIWEVDKSYIFLEIQPHFSSNGEYEVLSSKATSFFFLLYF